MFWRYVHDLNAAVDPTTAMTFGNRFVLLRRRQVLDAAIGSPNTIGLAVIDDKASFVRV